MAKYTLLILVLVRYFVSSQSIDPCLALSEAYQSRVSNNQTRLFRPSEVLACLRTVPVNETLSVGQIEWYRNFIQFQSTLSYLRDPPSEYQLPAVDILGGLQSIQSRVESGGYNSTLYIELDLTNLVNAAYDGHFGVATQLSVYNFGGFRNVQLVSVSSNGTDLPKVYFIDDISEPNVSDLVSIDGVEVTKAIESLAIRFQNLDALYNSMLSSLPAKSNGNSFYDQTQILIERDNTTYEFRNGTSKTVDNSMAVKLLFSNITSGQDVYDRFLIQQTPTNNSNNASTSEIMAVASSTMASSSSSASPANSLVVASVKFPRSGYPIPLYVNSDFILAGFFLQNSTDTCVLSSTAFEDLADASLGVPIGANATAYALDFQNTAKDFFAACKKDGRTKLLIDIRSNGGGHIYYAYDLFGQLFPSRKPYSGTRFRAHPAVDIMGRVISTLGSFRIGDDDPVVRAQATVFDYFSSLSSPSEAPFSSWTELYGPEIVHSDAFSNLLSWNLQSVALDLASSGLVPAGEANNTQVAAQPFADKDIILITDAQCSSTCGTFVNLLLSQTNISTIAFGGRPSRDPMAVIGGVQGSEVFSYTTIYGLAKVAVSLLTDNATSASASKGLNITKEKALQILRPLTMSAPLRTYGFAEQSVNFLDSIPQNDATMTPLQFLPPTLADCRTFYLAGDILNVTYTWERVARGDFVCVDGGVLGRKRNGTGTSNLTLTYTGSAIAGKHVEMYLSFGFLVSLILGLFMTLL